jgi:hypothetical protein
MADALIFSINKQVTLISQNVNQSYSRGDAKLIVLRDAGVCLCFLTALPYRAAQQPFHAAVIEAAPDRAASASRSGAFTRGRPALAVFRSQK